MVRIGQDMLPSSCLHPARPLAPRGDRVRDGGREGGISAFVKVAFRASSSAIATNSGRVEERRRRRMPCTPATYLLSQVHDDPEIPEFVVKKIHALICLVHVNVLVHICWIVSCHL